MWPWSQQPDIASLLTWEDQEQEKEISNRDEGAEVEDETDLLVLQSWGR